MKTENKIPEQDTPVILSANRFPVVGIGASAGGLEAFKKLIKAIPENSGMAYVLVQHLDPDHESILTNLLQKVTKIKVSEITDEIKVEPNHIYIIPSNKMLVANDGVLKLSPRPERNKTDRNLPIDIFFNSLAEVHREHAIGVVLSGTASDGTLGLKAIKDNGGITFAQDEISAAYDGMPKSAVLAGVVDFVLPPEEIPGKLLEIKNRAILTDEELTKIAPEEEDVFRRILALLLTRKGTDFTHYKQTTIRRRILRRMSLKDTEQTASYLKYLQENKQEQDALYQDLLIPVTSFFRDHKVFDNLCETVFPRIVKTTPSDEPIRIWVAACSTGEEAYSMAMCLLEYLGDSKDKVQIFATDLSEPAILKARSGIYKNTELTGVSAHRLDKFFTKRPDGYRISKQVRDLCIFAAHNFLKDPPFGKMDFVSCRNVLIYMEPYLQKRALTTFHYALNSGGLLLLGKSETGSSVPSLFDFAEKGDKLFTRKNAPSRFIHVTGVRKEPEDKEPRIIKADQMQTDFQKSADDLLLSRYTPASVVINDEMEIVHFRGNTSSYLEQAPGKPSHNLLKMSRPGLAFELRNIIQKARKSKAAVSTENIPLLIGTVQRSITIEALPLPYQADSHYLIIFRETLIAKEETLSEDGSKRTDEKDLLILQLERELAQAREDMRSISEEQEAANEELQSANEELLSSSEELQSLNEELESSKEELQSTNEELTVLNQELINLNVQFSEAQHYAESIVATVREPLIVLNRELRIKTANPAFYKTFLGDVKETEGILFYNLGNKEWNIPELRKLLEEVLLENKDFSDFELSHTFSGIGERVLMLNGRKIHSEKEQDLILISISDTTETVNALKRKEAQEMMVQNLFLNAPAFICTLRGPDHVYELVNERYQSLFGKRKLVGKPVMEAIPELKGQGFDILLGNVYKTGEPYVGIELPIFLARDVDLAPEERFFNLSYQPMYDENKNIFSILVFGYEVTEEVSAKRRNLESTVQRAKELEEKVRLRTLELLEANEELQEKNQLVAISKYNKRFLTEFSETFSGYKLHSEFFNSVVNYIADLTRLDYVFIGILKEKEDKKLYIETITITAFGKLVDNITYALPDGPCEQIIKGTLYSYPENSRAIFPKNETLKKFNVEGYLGYPLYDAKGNAMGLIAVMHEGKIVDVDTVSSVLKIVAKRAEMELERMQNETHLKNSNEALEIKNLELQRMNKELESFTYISSHDLQEPLRKIQTFAQLILKTEDAMSDTGKDYFQRMTNAAGRMQTLIEDLLTYSRTNAKERIFQKTVLKSIVDEAKMELKELLTEKNAVINDGDLGEADIIPFQFRQVIINLLTNSLKFAKPDVPAVINIKCICDEASALQKDRPVLSDFKKELLTPGKTYCHISFEDNGIGFDPQYKQKIFEVFQRLHGKEEYKGTGIGLAIVKKIVENHNGFINAESELGKGATFNIYLPHH